MEGLSVITLIFIIIIINLPDCCL